MPNLFWSSAREGCAVPWRYSRNLKCVSVAHISCTIARRHIAQAIRSGRAKRTTPGAGTTVGVSAANRDVRHSRHRTVAHRCQIRSRNGFNRQSSRSSASNLCPRFSEIWLVGVDRGSGRDNAVRNNKGAFGCCIIQMMSQWRNPMGSSPLARGFR